MPDAAPGRRAPRLGVTLAEVVTVLLIVALLAMLTVAVVERVRCSVMRAGCQAHLRVIGLACAAYAADCRSFLPADSDFGLPRPTSPAWFDRLPGYLDEERTRDRSVFQCPAFRPGPRRFLASQPRSLKMNAYLDDDGRARHYRRGSVRDEDEVVLMVDAVAGETGMGQWGRAVHSAVDDRRHRGAVNMLALDCATVILVPRPADGDWRQGLRWLSQAWLGP